MRRALITGITGQDGAHLTELLLSKGYHVFGMVRHTTATDNASNPLSIPKDASLTLLGGDMTDQSSLVRVLERAEPDEIYNLAAMSFVGASWHQPLIVNDVNGQGTLRLLEAARQVCPKARIYQASSSEMFGNQEAPQNELTPFRPRSPYGVSKVTAHQHAVVYRESHDMFACGGILFNHEGPRRGCHFVTRKITQTVAKIKMGMADKLELGDLSPWRDWGFAGDYVRAMWLMLQQDQPDDFVIGTGVCHQVGDFAEAALKAAGLDPTRHFGLDQAMFRPAEVYTLRADASKAKRVLGWEPTVDFNGLVKMMVEHDLELARKAA